MAFGDGENDIDMLRFVQIGVAMQNAEDCVKEAADYITDTSKNDGIYKALKHFIIKLRIDMMSFLFFIPT